MSECHGSGAERAEYSTGADFEKKGIRMSQLCDLCITLTAPPSGSPADTVACVAIACDVMRLSFTGGMLIDPLTQRERDDLQWYLEEYWKWPYLEFATRGGQVEAMLREIGTRLYQAVFGSSEAQSIVQAWQKQPGGQHQISIVSDIPRVLSLPWELLHDASGFLILSPLQPISIVRRLPQPEQALVSVSVEPPLRILLITARPEGTGFIDPRSIARELVDEVQAQVETGAIEIEFLRPPTFSNLQTRLRDGKRPIHVLHFDGHGTFDDGQHGQGLLLFETGVGRPNPVKGSDLAKVLRDSGVRLAVLTACQSAKSDLDDAFSSVAAQLIRNGIDAVVAMSSSILVASATRYVEVFYRALAAGVPVPVAQQRTQQALHDDPRRHLFRRRRDEVGTPVELLDWWIPHLYQQRTLLLQPVAGRSKSGEQRLALSAPHPSGQLPVAPRYGFSGRARELLQIERWLLQRKLIVMHGFGGIGKTALAREAADWLTRTGMYNGACFVSFEHGGDAAWLLGELGRYLEIYDNNYNPNDKAMVLARLKPALKERRILVLADNLESILSGGEAPLDDPTRTQLWDTLLDLAQLGAGVLLTSHATAFGDGRLAPGQKAAHLPLAGLYPEDAYTLATRLLTSLGIDRRRTPYAELRSLLRSLDHHPLAIQLVLPLLRQVPIARIAIEFALLLPKFEDDTATGRNRSLLASLECSLQGLSPAHRALLPRLALFEGGATEDNLLAITQIPVGEWATMRPALEQAALLTTEQVHKSLRFPYLHFHPVLAPFLRGQRGADDAMLRDSYRQRYYGLATYLYQQDQRRPLPVRALVQRELPNLRRALDLLLEAEEVDTASEMAECIVWFLNAFGLHRERDELRQRVEEVEARKEEARTGEALTWAEFLHESGRGEDELGQGNLRAASTRFTQLLARIEAQPAEAPLGRGTYDHCLTLCRLARCLRAGGQPDAAEVRLREALTLAEALLKEQPENKSCMRQRGAVLTDLGDALSEQGKYPGAREAYREALKVFEYLGDARSQAVNLGQLGTLALAQLDYDEAQSHYISALERFQSLDEPAMEAAAWHQLGIVAQRRQGWAEAEHCYRTSLVLKERVGDTAGAAMTFHQLAGVAAGAGRPSEAEGWYKRALEFDKQVDPGGPNQATDLTNLASLLTEEVQAGRAPVTRLVEARGYAEQALAIKELLDASSEIWTTLGILAQLAELEGRPDSVQAYRRRQRETLAAFSGNRYNIDQEFGALIAAIAAATGDRQARKAVEAELPQLEEDGWHIAAATHRIWKGERDWHALAENLNAAEALIVLRVLETLI